MTEEERRETDRAPGEPDWESLRAVHPAPPSPFPARPKARPKAEGSDVRDEPPRRSRRKAIVAMILMLLGGVRLLERLVNGSNRAR